MCSGVNTCVGEHVCVCGGQRITLLGIPQVLFTFGVCLFLRLSLSEAWTLPTKLGWLATEPRKLPVSSSPAPGLLLCAAIMLGF